MRQSNYEITKEKMAKHFLDFDQGTMISRMHLRYDSRYLYIRFVGRWYRIDRSSGLVQWSEDGFRHGIEGDFNEAMSIYDLLCCSKEGCCLAGEFVKLRNGTKKYGTFYYLLKVCRHTAHGHTIVQNTHYKSTYNGTDHRTYTTGCSCTTDIAGCDGIHLNSITHFRVCTTLTSR